MDTLSEGAPEGAVLALAEGATDRSLSAKEIRRLFGKVGANRMRTPAAPGPAALPVTRRAETLPLMDASRVAP